MKLVFALLLVVGAARPCFALRLKYAAKTRPAELVHIPNGWSINTDAAAFVLCEGPTTVLAARKAAESVTQQYLEASQSRGSCAKPTPGEALWCGWNLVPNHSAWSFMGVVVLDDRAYFSQEGFYSIVLVRGGKLQKLQGKTGSVQVQAGDMVLLASRAVAALSEATIISLLQRASGDLERAVDLLTQAPLFSKTNDDTAILLWFPPPK